MASLFRPITRPLFRPLFAAPNAYVKGGFDWYPNRLFQSGDILLWYDPSDLTTMFTNTTGTTQVAADGDSVALMLDKGQWGGKTLSQVKAAATELRGNGTIELFGSATAATYNTSTGAGTVTRVDSGNQSYVLLPVGGTNRRVFIDIEVVGSPGIWVRQGAVGASLVTPTPGRFTYLLDTGIYNTLGLFVNAGSGTGSFIVHSVKEIPGYHRTQATGTSMPKYKTDGTLHWLLYDGTDDGHATGTITWGTDEVAACVGVTKSSDSGAAPLVESSASSSTNAGSFAIFAPYTNSTANYGFRSRGSASSDAASAGYAAPTTNVLTGQGKISTDVSTLRADGAQVATSATDQGTGNFGDYPLNFGRRNNASLPFNGREYQTVIRSRLLSASELAKLETFVAAKTGVIL